MDVFCDYCGAKLDVEHENCCTQCGAPFDNNVGVKAYREEKKRKEEEYRRRQQMRQNEYNASQQPSQSNVSNSQNNASQQPISPSYTQLRSLESHCFSSVVFLTFRWNATYI